MPSQKSQEYEYTSYEKNAALFTVALASFLTPFVVSSLNVALPSIAEEFSLNAVMTSWVATSYLLASAIFLVPFGRLADIYGRRKLFITGIIIFTLSSLFTALSPSPYILIISRLSQGFGAAMIFATGIAILTSIFPTGERGKALGINVAAVYFALSLGPLLGGILTQKLGWRSIFYATIPMGTIVLIVSLIGLKHEWAEAKKEKFDAAGSTLYGLSLAAVIYGALSLPRIKGIILISVGIIFSILFVIWETRTDNPVLDMKLFFKNRMFGFSNLAAYIHYSGTFAVAFLLSLYLQYVNGFSPQTAGLILVAKAAFQTLFSPFAGKLSDRVAPRTIATVGISLSTIGLLLFTFINSSTSIIFIIFVLAILGAGFGIFSSPNTNAAMGSVKSQVYGMASATVATMRVVGQMTSMAIATSIFAIVIGTTEISSQSLPLFLKSLKIAFPVLALICFAGIIVSLARSRRPFI